MDNIKLEVKENMTEKIGKIQNQYSKDELKKKMVAASKLLLKSVLRNFAEEGRPIKWKPSLRALGIQEKIKALGRRKKAKTAISRTMGRSKTLFLKGDLYGAIQDFVEQRENEIVGGVEVLNLVKYARIQQLGGMTGRKHASELVPRPYLIFQDKDIEEIMEIFNIKLETK